MKEKKVLVEIPQKLFFFYKKKKPHFSQFFRIDIEGIKLSYLNFAL